MQNVRESLAKAKAQKCTAVMARLCAGYPDVPSFWPLLIRLAEAQVDVLELVVPFSDGAGQSAAMAAMSRKALQEGMTLKNLFHELGQCRAGLAAPVVLSGFYNPFLQYGLKEAVQDAADAGVQAFQVFDLPLEESGPLCDLLQKQGLDYIPCVGPASSHERMAYYAAQPSPMVQLNMAWERGQFEDLSVLDVAVRRVREVFQRPVAVVLVETDAADMGEMPAEGRPDVIILDSRLVRRAEAGDDLAACIRNWW